MPSSGSELYSLKLDERSIPPNGVMNQVDLRSHAPTLTEAPKQVKDRLQT